MSGEWTDKEVRELRQRINKGQHLEMIARCMGKTTSSVRSKIERLNRAAERKRQSQSRTDARYRVQRIQLMMMPEGQRPKPSTPPCAWLERPHPVPDIEDRIRQLSKQSPV